MKRPFDHGSVGRVGRAALLLSLGLICACAATSGGNNSTSRDARSRMAQEGKQITLEELGQLTTGFADRYFSYIVSATGEMEKGELTSEQRRLLHQVKLVEVSSIYDIVTNADPFSQLLDLTLVVTLQSQKWIDEDLAEEWFGEQGEHIISASRRAREDIWKIAGKVMRPEQLEVLDYLIWDWRRKNSDVQVVSFVRFDDFAASRGKSIVADVKTGTGLLAPVDEAKKAVDEVRLLTERAFFYGKRMPFLMNWQVEAAVDNVTENPNIKGVTKSVADVTKSVDRVTKVVERMPNEIARERERIFTDVRRMEPFIRTTFGQYRGAITETDELVGSVKELADTATGLLTTVQDTTKAVNTTMNTVDKVFLEPGKKDPKPKDEKPFNVESYTQTALAVGGALKEANQLMAGAGTMLTSPQLDQPLGKLSAVAAERVEHAAAQGTKIINVAFWRVAVLIVLFFVCLAAYKFFAVKILGARRSTTA